MIESNFLISILTEDGTDIPNQKTRFLEVSKLYLVAAKKDSKSEKVRITLILRRISPRGIDPLKSFTFTAGKSMKKYDDVIKKFQVFHLNTSKNFVKRHQFLLTIRECMSIDEYVKGLRFLLSMHKYYLSIPKAINCMTCRTHSDGFLNLLFYVQLSENAASA